MMDEKRLFLLDAYALIFRAYYALIKMPRLRRDGFNTSAIFGFVNTLEEVIRKEHPSHLAVCFDPAGPTFRSEADASYKASREATPEDIKLSVPIIKEIIQAYNIPILEVEKFEADDVIGTMATIAAKEGFTVYMMTPDKDFGQLVTPNIFQYKPAYRGQDFEIRGEEEICARYGLQNTRQVIDYLALVGDKIDNIPGCPGVGEVTAVKLLTQFGSVENMLAHTDEIKGAIRKKVEENAMQIRESYFLATIRTDVPIDLSPYELKMRHPDRKKLFAIFDELEFRTLRDRVARRLDSGQPVDHTKSSAGSFPTSLFDIDNPVEPVPVASHEIEEINFKWETATESSMLNPIIDTAYTEGFCGINFIADGENDMTASIKGISLALSDGRCVFIPITEKTLIAKTLDLLAAPDILKITSAAKRDYVLATRLRNDYSASLVNYFDVSLAHYLLQPEMRHSLDLLASSYLGYESLPEPQISIKKNSKTPSASQDEIARWSCQQSFLALRLKPFLEEEIIKENMEVLLNDVEFPLSAVLAEMEICGVRIDVKALDEAASELNLRISTLEREIYFLAGEEFNVSSPSKVGEILFEKLELAPKAKKTKTGQYSTSEDVLEKIAHKNPIVGKILEYRQLKKLVITYLTALPASINPATGKIHTVYNQTVTATGRISSSSPNLQNIPIREDEGRGIRRAFIADPGHLFLSADYSQIELRLVADFANDTTMLDAFANGDDIHAITAAKIYHKPLEEVTSDERRHAKTANFGILYGISAFGLASRLGIPRTDAKELIDNYFATFPTIHNYMNQAVENARDTGYVVTNMGRRRMLPDINSKNPVVRGYAERNAVNAPIQGSAADIIKVAMVRIARRMNDLGLKSKMIMQVHDELNFDVVPEELPELQHIVTTEMEGAYSGRVTLTASSGVADNWLEAH